MSEPGFASLGPTLLARKGGAKPAMRPQLAPLVQDEAGVAEEQLEDLGWNDMGHDDADMGAGVTEGSADVVPINAGVSADEFGQEHSPVVRRQQRRLEERVLADAVMSGPEDLEPDYDSEDEAFYGDDYAEDEAFTSTFSEREPVPQAVPVTTIAKPRVPAVQAGRRAAFTLRLDVDRHLKLRLAATMQGVSAQALVTEALDQMLAEFDDLDVIANHLKRN
ncbi:MAG: type II toxin-antitoxin system HicB family antitoxin [Erythrobacter sp.]|nr:type II toxin-antitoxin system HicB family antitoxin [Erythrobacter sp.]